jgi:hypothetical protein
MSQDTLAYHYFDISSGKIAASGNIMFLMDKTGELRDLTGRDHCYYFMFSACTSLTQAPTLPATTLADGCYSGMFDGCESLTQAPALPVTTLADSCYSGMFSNCYNLTQAPELPATTLADECYDFMFYGCTALTSASFPNLEKDTVATEVVENHAFFEAAYDIETTCKDGILIINSSEA